MAKDKKEVLMDGVSFQSVALKQIIKPKRTERNRNLGSLKAAIRKHRTVSPILLKPEGDRYHVIWGTRRFYACLEEKYTEIPAYIVEADDLKAQSLRVIENAERLDVPLLEEAEEIGELLNLGEEPQVIADSIGRSVTWVMRRAKLLSLSDRWKDIVTTGYALIPTAEPPDEEYEEPDQEEVEYEEEADSELARMDFNGWSATHFLAIARFEPHVQDEILDFFLRTPYYVPSTMSVRELETRIQGYQRTLSQAPWDLERDGLAGVGSCRKCMRRLCFQPTLFDDEERTEEDDQCLDRACWQQKMEAYVLQRKEALEKDHPDIVLQQGMRQTSDLPDGSPLLEGTYEPHELVQSAPEEEGAFPVLIVNGPEAGEVEWRRVNPHDTALPSRYNEDGTRKPMTLAERRARIHKRRTTKYIKYLKELLESEMKEPKVFLSECVTEGAVVAAAAAFGLNPFHLERDRWTKFQEYLGAYDGEDGERKEVFLGILNGIAGEWVKGLDMQLGRDGRQREYMDGIMAFVGLDPEAKWDEMLKEIPDPKSWATLNEDGTPKTKE